MLNYQRVSVKYGIPCSDKDKWCYSCNTLHHICVQYKLYLPWLMQLSPRHSKAQDDLKCQGENGIPLADLFLSQAARLNMWNIKDNHGWCLRSSNGMCFAWHALNGQTAIHQIFLAWNEHLLLTNVLWSMVYIHPSMVIASKAHNATPV